MNTPEYTPQYVLLNELYIDTVVIDDTEYLTLWCFTMLDEEYKFIYLGCDFTQFNQILIGAGEKGKEMALHVADILNSDYEIPTVIPIKEQFDEYLELLSYDIVVYEPMALEDEEEEDEEDEDEEEEPDDEDELFINQPDSGSKKYLIYQLDKLYPSKVFEPEQMLHEEFVELLEDDSLELAQLYYDYLNAIENGYPEQEARQLAGLEKELFFRVARKSAELWK
ncbi:hypothetical protein [Botryobacter ruber]|uniref:hypothetical protein n=1 Tax=Botryobacter ruber TaxID=2171629 RepID=UPI000E0A36D4|nr:hypothetical protein [Botryobacter ruber]